MDDFGNELHWTDTTKGWHSLGYYGYSDAYGIDLLFQAVDFGDLRP